MAVTPGTSHLQPTFLLLEADKVIIFKPLQTREEFQRIQHLIQERKKLQPANLRAPRFRPLRMV
jgi:hypothetical protein